MPPSERALEVTALWRSLKLLHMVFIVWRIMKPTLYRPHMRYWFEAYPCEGSNMVEYPDTRFYLLVTVEGKTLIGNSDCSIMESNKNIFLTH